MLLQPAVLRVVPDRLLQNRGADPNDGKAKNPNRFPRRLSLTPRGI